MNRSTLSFAALCCCFVLFLILSYFGHLSPYPLVLLSGLCVTSAGLGITLIAFSKGRKVYFSTALGLWLVLTLLTLSDWWYADFFQSYFNYQALALGGDATESVKSLSAFPYQTEAMVFSASTLFCLLLSFVFYRKPEQKPGYIRNSQVLLAFLFIASFTITWHSYQNYKRLNLFTLSPALLHPVHAFFFSLDQGKRITTAERQSWRHFKALNRSLSNEDQTLDSGKNYNVILIVLESFRASLTGYYGGEKLTPNFDRLANENLVFNNFYANSNYTMKGEMALLCGLFDNNAKPPISKSHEQVKSLRCLPKILAESGYHTAYFHGYKGSFNDRRDFLPLVGFEQLYFHADAAHGRIPDSSYRIGWGVADTFMYRTMLEQLRQVKDRPFFAEIMTLSSHYPFNGDWGIDVPYASNKTPTTPEQLYNNYKNAIYYEDYALGTFWDKFIESPLYGNTIVVITADHGIWSFDAAVRDNPLLENEQFFRLPLVIYHPDLQKHREIKTLASQIDVPPTVLSLLGRADSQDFIGKNALAQIDTPWAIMMKNGEIVTRFKDKICYKAVSSCAGNQQNCVSESAISLFDGVLQNIDCVAVAGDLLRGGKVTPIDNDADLMRQAFDLVRYSSKSVFQENSSPSSKLITASGNHL